MFSVSFLNFSYFELIAGERVGRGVGRGTVRVGCMWNSPFYIVIEHEQFLKLLVM